MSNGERRLAAIMFTDIVGYTSLTQKDESSTLQALERHRSLLRPIFSSHGGREIKTIGDAFLIEFQSALDAVLCGVAVQQMMHDRKVARGEQFSLRIGIHVGDVVESGNDILGDAVNIASRIYPLAEPGGICISEEVQRQVRNKFDLRFVSLGEKSLKNVSEPVELYRLVMPWAGEVAPKPAQLDRKRVAVLPFANISPNPSDEFFADGMTEELINTISHNQQLKVIARTSVGRFKGSLKSVSEIAREIGVGSILEGSVRKAGNKIRVTAQLIDATTEEHVWSDNYDRQVDDVFAIQSEIAVSVSEALKTKLLPEEWKTVGKRATVNPSAYVLYLKGRTSLRGRSEEAIREAKRCFEEALAEDANYAEAYAGLADALFLLGSRRHMPMSEAWMKGRAALEKALSLNENLAEAHNTLANYLLSDYKFADAEREFKRALSLNQNYALAHHWYSVMLLEEGRLRQGTEEILQAEDSDPLSAVITYGAAVSLAYLGDTAGCEARIKKLRELGQADLYADSALGWLLWLKGDSEGAVKHIEQAVKSSSEGEILLSILGMFYGRLGLRDKARKVLEQFMGLPDDAYGKSFDLATVYAGLGEKDEMFRCLDRALEDRSLEFRTLRYLPFDPEIRKDPRYIELFQRVGLEP